MNKFSKTKILTVERAAEWLNYPTWKRHEAILIFSGYDPESHRFYDEDDAQVSKAQLLHQGLPRVIQAPWQLYFDWTREKRVELPLALIEALQSEASSSFPHLSESLQVSAEKQLIVESTAPEPVTTLQVAGAFFGLHWDYEKWKKNLGNKPKWLKACMVTAGQQGGAQATWNPVLIGAALLVKGIKQHQIRGSFQKAGSPIAHWFEAWKDYEATHCDSP